MAYIQDLEVYVANLAILNPKLHNLHWNVVGPQFKSIHEFTEELYDDVFAKFDDVAERLKMLGHMPATTLSAYLKLGTIEELEPKNFSFGEVLNVVEGDLKAMRTSAISIRSSADEAGDFGTVALMEDHVAGYDKTLWFIAAMGTQA